MKEIRGKLKNLKKKEKSKSRNKVIKNNIEDLKELYKELDETKIESGKDIEESALINNKKESNQSR
mgnify:CR=1 FL=1